MLSSRNFGASPSPAHWSKDFVEHLRTVHFALVAVSVGVILILGRTNSPALSQIRQIVQLKKQWPPQWFKIFHGEELQYHDCPAMPTGIGQSLKEVEGHVLPRTLGKSFFIRFGFPRYNWHYTGQMEEFPATLSEFREWWNQIGTGYRAHIIFPGRLCKEGLVYRYPWSEWEPTVATMDLDFTPGQYAESGKVLSLALGGHGYRAIDLERGLVYELPLVDVHKVNLDQDVLITGVSFWGWHWTKGPFERSFSALAQETNGLDAEDLEEVEKVVSERLTKVSEEFDAFGMKFPISQVTLWGTVILLGVQLYFLLYLKQLSAKLGPDDPGWETPWICMDQSFWARVVLFTTVIVLPVAAMLLLGSRATLRLTAGYWVPDSWHLLVKIRDWERVVLVKIAVFALASILALVMGILSWIYRPRLNAIKEQHCPAQLFE